jgi:anti-sigma B factor antagonist
MSANQNHNPVKSIEWEGRIVTIHLAGDFNMVSSKHFQDTAVDVMSKKPSAIIVDLAEVPYMDSSGVASLVKLLTQSKRSNTAMALVGVGQRVMSILEITRLNQSFKIFPTQAEALAAL